MAEATCRRELELEIPAEEVTKKIESVAKEFARLANVPGFRRGKAEDGGAGFAKREGGAAVGAAGHQPAATSGVRAG